MNIGFARCKMLKQVWHFTRLHYIYKVYMNIGFTRCKMLKQVWHFTRLHYICIIFAEQ